MDENFTILKNQVICVEDDKIVYIVRMSRSFFIPMMNAKNKIVMPPFNAHTHCAMTLMRNRPTIFRLKGGYTNRYFRWKPIHIQGVQRSNAGNSGNDKRGNGLSDMYYIHEASLEAIKETGITNLSYGYPHPAR